MSDILAVIILVFIAIMVFKNVRLESPKNSYVCRYCGQKGICATPGAHCNVSFSHKHEIIAESELYVCKYCGQKSNNPIFASGVCCCGPDHRHCLINGKDLYVCKYCGQSSSNPRFVSGMCQRSKNPNHLHELLD